jgi:hypothetical protein
MAVAKLRLMHGTYTEAGLVPPLLLPLLLRLLPLYQGLSALALQLLQQQLQLPSRHLVHSKAATSSARRRCKLHLPRLPF